MSEGSETRLVLMTKYPRPGEVKTRLIPALNSDGAARVHATLAKRTYDILAQVARGKQVRLQVHYSGASFETFENWLGGEADYCEQAEGNLGDRLFAAANGNPVVIFGADTPDLSAELVEQSAAALKDHDVVIGPAEDGGYYLIGMTAPYSFLFEDMPWSSDKLLPETLRRLSAAKKKFKLLDMLSDCDRPEDLKRWPWLN